MNFEFVTARKIIVKTNGLESIKKLASNYGKKALLVGRQNDETTNKAKTFLQEENMEVVEIFVKGEPTLEALNENTAIARKANVDVVIGIGGGSVIDMAKMISALITNTNDVLDYLEVIGKAMPLENAAKAFIAIPTTSGTGAEVTKNGVVSSKEHQVKVSLRSESMYADVVLLDAALTLSLPKHVTASTGMDALTQNIEPYVSIMANPITDAFAKEGIQKIASSIKIAYDNGSDLQARENMAIGSLMGGFALANAKLGAVHGFAGVLGGMYDINHGVICAMLLPHVMSANIQALHDNDPQHPTLKRFDHVAQLLTNKPNAKAKDGIDWVRNINEHFNMPTLRDLNVKKEDFDEIVEKSKNSSSMKGNPIALTSDQLRNILLNAY